jgi:hypothetical protein
MLDLTTLAVGDGIARVSMAEDRAYFDKPRTVDYIDPAGRFIIYLVAGMTEPYMLREPDFEKWMPYDQPPPCPIDVIVRLTPDRLGMLELVDPNDPVNIPGLPDDVDLWLYPLGKIPPDPRTPIGYYTWTAKGLRPAEPEIEPDPEPEDPDD